MLLYFEKLNKVKIFRANKQPVTFARNKNNNLVHDMI
jgi:hypothetical protein